MFGDLGGNGGFTRLCSTKDPQEFGHRRLVSVNRAGMVPQPLIDTIH